MTVSIRTAPPHSLLFVSDRDFGVVPEIARDARIWATPTCIVIGCLAFMDGETDVILGGLHDVDPKQEPALDRMLETPFRTVVVSTSDGEPLLTKAVANRSTRVCVWTNRASELDRVVIGLE